VLATVFKVVVVVLQVGVHLNEEPLNASVVKPVKQVHVLVTLFQVVDFSSQETLLHVNVDPDRYGVL